MITPIPLKGYWQMSPGGIYVPPGERVTIPPSPPRELRRNREKEVRKDIQPLRCPGLAPVAWREYQECMPTPLINHTRAFRTKNFLTATAPTHFWQMDDEVGSNQTDTVGALDLVPTNLAVSRVSAKIGYGIRPDPAGNSWLDGGTTGTDFVMGAGVNFTFAIWAYLHQAGDIFAKIGNTNNFEYKLDVIQNGGPSGKPLPRWDCTVNGTTTNIRYWSADLEWDTWYFIVAKWRSATADMYLNVNAGTPVTLSLATGVFAGNSPFTVGSALPSNKGAGAVDALGLWRGVTTSSGDETTIYNSGRGAEYSEGSWHW